MKITDFVLAYFAIFLSVFVVIEIQYEKTKTYIEYDHFHEGAFTTATQDAIHILRTNVKPSLEAGYDSYKINPVNPQPAFDTFVQSLAVNYRVKNEYTINQMLRYIPVFAILDYDGLLLNVYKPYKDKRGDEVVERVWLPKIPLSYADNEGNIINFTIDEDLEVYDKDLNEWYFGKRAELAKDPEITIPLLKDEKEFDQIRRQTIVGIVQENLAYYINEHNVYTKALDVTYKFAIPLIPQEDWYNTVDDISIFAFVQGYPYKVDTKAYNEYAFVGTRLHYKNPIYAGVVNNERRFWYKSCDFNYKANEIYSTKKQAAAAGYRELSCLNINK